MSETTAPVKFTREQLDRDLVAILSDMTTDWDLDLPDGITPETRLMADLAFESIDVVQLVAQRVRDAVVEGEHLLHPGQHDAAGVRQGRLAARAVEQLGAELFLERLHLQNNDLLPSQGGQSHQCNIDQL